MKGQGQSTKAIWAALGANFAIFVIKLISAIISGSAAMFSEALHSVADFFNSIFLLIGMRLAVRPEDEEHPFGYGKEVYFWSFLASVFMLGVTSMGSIFRGYHQIIDPEPLENFNLVIGALILTIIFECYAVYSATRAVLADAGREEKGFAMFTKVFDAVGDVKNPAVKFIFFEDMVALSGVFLALIAIILVKYTGKLVVDGVVSMLIGVILAILALLLGLENRSMIIGRAADDETELNIGNLAMTIPHVRDIHSLKTMFVGPHSLLVHMEIELTPELVVEKADDVIALVETVIREKVPEAKYFSIEIMADDYHKDWHG